MNNNPVVSIICLTYNQEKFVRDCLDGFMAQKTDFPFEILIYDDASTDSTPDIIREYAEKHPDGWDLWDYIPESKRPEANMWRTVKVTIIGPIHSNFRNKLPFWMRTIDLQYVHMKQVSNITPVVMDCSVIYIRTLSSL